MWCVGVLKKEDRGKKPDMKYSQHERDVLKEIVISWQNLWRMLHLQASCGRNSVNIGGKRRKGANRWWIKRKMDFGWGGLRSRPPRGPQLRSDPWLSNSMNSGESSSVASVRDYQHTHTQAQTPQPVTHWQPQCCRTHRLSQCEFLKPDSKVLCQYIWGF